MESAWISAQRQDGACHRRKPELGPRDRRQCKPLLENLYLYYPESPARLAAAAQQTLDHVDILGMVA